MDRISHSKRFGYRELRDGIWLVFRLRNDQPMAYVHSEASAKMWAEIYEGSSR